MNNKDGFIFSSDLNDWNGVNLNKQRAKGRVASNNYFKQKQSQKKSKNNTPNKGRALYL